MFTFTSQKELSEYLQAQLDEIYKYKWYLGEKLHKDPLDIYTLNEISMMWIKKYAEEFRIQWLKTHKKE